MEAGNLFRPAMSHSPSPNRVSLCLDDVRGLFCDISELQNQKLVHGRTGNVSFNSAGDRLNAVYDIVNIQTGGNVTVGHSIVDNVSCCAGCFQS